MREEKFKECKRCHYATGNLGRKDCPACGRELTIKIIHWKEQKGDKI